MLLNFDETVKLIESGTLLHVAATEALLKKLPKGKWIGGSTEYFMSEEGGVVSGELLYVTEFPFAGYSVKSYSAAEISKVTNDAFDNGFTVLIIPFDSAVHREYAEKASEFDGMFMKQISGWISGLNLGIAGQTPIAVDGVAGEAFTDRAVALHLEVPDDKMACINIINIFEQDEKSPVIKFTEEGFSVKKCLIDGKETVFADYITENNIDTKLPLVGSYSGTGVNISFKAVENGTVNFYAPVFSGIEYKIAKSMPNYAEAFRSRIDAIHDTSAVFSCNCILNFLYGELEGKKIEAFAGPITFGEIAYQLVNQTLVYVTVD